MHLLDDVEELLVLVVCEARAGGAGKDVLKIYTLKYELSDIAVREANPPVNASDLSSVDGPVGWRRATR